MQDVHALIRRLLPPGRVTTCTVWTLGSHRRVVRRWECDTDLPKPGPFPQVSHTAALLQAPQRFGGPALRIDLDEPDGPGRPGPAQDTDCCVQPPKRSTAQRWPRPALSPPLARLNEPVWPPPAGPADRQPPNVS